MGYSGSSSSASSDWVIVGTINMGDLPYNTVDDLSFKTHSITGGGSDGLDRTADVNGTQTVKYSWAETYISSYNKTAKLYINGQMASPSGYPTTDTSRTNETFSFKPADYGVTAGNSYIAYMKVYYNANTSISAESGHMTLYTNAPTPSAKPTAVVFLSIN